MPHCFKMSQTQKTRATPARSSRLRVSLRSLATPWLAGPRHYLSAYAASLRSVAPGSISFFVLYRWLRGYAAPPPAIVFRPFGALNSARKLLVNFRFIEQSKWLYQPKTYTVTSFSPSNLSFAVCLNISIRCTELMPFAPHLLSAKLKFSGEKGLLDLSGISLLG